MLYSVDLPEVFSAVVMDSFGSPEVLHLREDVPMLVLQAGQVLVEVAFAGLNPVDYKTREGKGWAAKAIEESRFARHESAILGFDLAGYVVASSDARFGVGDKVCALSFAGGGYGQYALVEADLLVKVPDGVDLASAGAVPCAGVTALQWLNVVQPVAGEHFVVNAPAGGVGHLLIQMLLRRSVRLTLIASQEKFEALSEFLDLSGIAGWLDYREADFADRLADLNADVLLDLVGGEAGKQALSALKVGGRAYVLPTIWVEALAQAGQDRQVSVSGFIAKPNAADLAQVLQDLADQTLRLYIQARYPLVAAGEAHRVLEQGKTFGKLVFAVQDGANLTSL